MRLIRSSVAAALIVMAVGPAWAEDAPGALFTSSYQALPADAAVTVRPLDNSRENLALVKQFDAALAKRAMSAQAPTAPLVLNFDTEVQPLLRPGAGLTLGEARVTNRDSQVRINLWSTTQDSVLQGRRGDAATQAAVRYVLTATLDDARTGQRLWQGEARYAGGDRDQSQAWAAMVPLLVAELGKTVRARSFTLD
jgi:hypothetical protein